MSVAIELAERGVLPDRLIRTGIRRLLKARIRDELSAGKEGLKNRHLELLDLLRQSPITIHADDANAQHYEVPSEYFRHVLGKRLKYSSCLWTEDTLTLDQAEEQMLALTCERAEIVDGMKILELGCGWGSLTLWMAERYPSSSITAVSNSATQRAFILQQASERGLSNIAVETCDVSRFEPKQTFDRIVSVEMFEHVRNYERFFAKLAGWLKLDGMLFTHVFYHGRTAYTFETDGRNDWMARHFFTGGTMPSVRLFSDFQKDLKLKAFWEIDGTHYQKTLEAWLVRHDRCRDSIMPLFVDTYGRREAKRMFQRWRMFYLACSELFGFDEGKEWGVAHFLFDRQEAVQ